MKYTTRILLNEIQYKYKNIIGWGVGPLLFMNYKPYYFKMDFLIDGTGKESGTYYKDIKIEGSEAISKITGRSLIIIYSIYENQIIEQINQYKRNDIDVIIYSLLDIELNNSNKRTMINAKSCEDMLILMLTRQLKLDVVQFLEIGVCHPIMRNNTYLLYEQFAQLDGYKGVLVESNPLCWNLISEYRNKDILVQRGVVKRKGKRIFYIFPDLLGHSTFIEKTAQEKIAKGYRCQEIDMEIERIDDIIEYNFDRIPDILSLDAEGLDYEILLDWDYKKYPFKIVVSEIMEENKEAIKQLMNIRGYRVYAETPENFIWIRREEMLYI